MIKISKVVADRYPRIAKTPIVGRLFVYILRKLFHEDYVNSFIHNNRQWQGMEFNSKVLEYFNYSYFVNNNERYNIPQTGRVLIVANHPIGTLDGLALLKLVSEVRSDVKVVVNRFLFEFFEPLRELFIPLDNMSKNANAKEAVRNIIKSLKNEEAIIMFPAGEVSRMSPKGVRDGEWKKGIWYFIEHTHCPIVPVHITGRNSPMFYSLSSIYKSLGTFMLVNEMFKQHNKNLSFRIGDMIPYSSFAEHKNKDRKTLSHMLRQHLYRLPKRNKNLIFKTEKTIGPSSSRAEIMQELTASELISSGHNGHEVYLVQFQDSPATIHEIGRLRELAFRQVGEGSGKAIDLDEYDKYYDHLVLWNSNDLEIAGAYRMGCGSHILDKYGLEGFYTSSLLTYTDKAIPLLREGVELGRSFVHPRYWGNRSLDFLWSGIGAYLCKNQEIRYLFGPVSISNNYPAEARALIIAFYHRFHRSPVEYARAKLPYHFDKETEQFVDALPDDSKLAYISLKRHLFKNWRVQVPTLYKQYAQLTDNGTHFISFGFDPEFGNCVDGTIIVDMDTINPPVLYRNFLPHGIPDEEGYLHWRKFKAHSSTFENE